MSLLVEGHLSHVLPATPPHAAAHRRVDIEVPLHFQLTLSPLRVLRTLMQIIGVLCAMSLTVQAMAFNFGHRRLFGFADEFNMNREGNIPSWYSSITLLAAAGLLWLIARTHRMGHLPFVRQLRALAMIFVLLSLDEACSIHEMMLLATGGRSVFHYAWVMAATPMVALLGFAYLRLLLWLPARSRMLFIVSGALYVGGALGMEMLDGWWASLHGDNNLVYALLTTLEEALEMSGVALFIYANLDYLRRLQSPCSSLASA